MDFNRAEFNKYISNIFFQGAKKKDSTSSSPKNIVQSPTEKSPNDSAYWLAFCGLSNNSKAKAFDEIHKLYCDFNRRNEEYKEVHRTTMTKIPDTMACAAACIDETTGLPNKDVLKFIGRYIFEDDTSLVNRLKGKPYYASLKNAYIGRLLPDLINFMKDNTGSFNRKNIKYLSRFMEGLFVGNNVNMDFFNSLKDENGVIDKEKFKIASKMSEKCSIEEIAPALKIMSSYDAETNENIISTMTEIFGSYDCALKNYANCVPFLFSELGEVNSENADFAYEFMLNASEDAVIPSRTFELIKNEDNKALLLQLSSLKHFITEDIAGVVDTISRFNSKDGKLPSFIKDKLIEASKDDKSFIIFDEILKNCLTDEKFDEETFDNMLNVFSKTHFLYSIVLTEGLEAIVRGTFKPDGLTFKDKVKILDELSASNIEAPFIDKTISDIDKSLSLDDIALEVSEEDRISFLKSVLSSKPNELSDFEKTMVDAIPVLESHKDGLPLSYSRENFLSDLNRILDTDAKREDFMDKTNVQLIEEFGQIIGYNGIIAINKLDKNDASYEICHKFMYENEVQTGNKKLDLELNKIIKALPEFINTIGKKQHQAHNYTLDIHQLLVLSYSIQNPDYNNLKGDDKLMLKLASILHDVLKSEEEVDKEHQTPSSVYARGIVKKFFNNPESRDRVYGLIKNHHWLEEFANSYDKDATSKEIAYNFRRNNDFEIAKIMAKSDLMAVSESFYEFHRAPLDKIESIEKMRMEFNAKGCAVFSDYPVDLSKAKIVDINGKKCKVIDLTSAREDDYMGEYGFNPNSKKKDLYFLVHMVETQGIKNNLNKVKMLSSSINGGVLSESLITPKYNRTYSNRKYGALLSQINSNVININDENQGSGYEKDFKDLMNFVYGNRTNARSNFKNQLLLNLGIDVKNVSDEEFADFYSKNIAPKNALIQYSKTAEYTLGGKKFTNVELKDAIKNLQDSLIDKREKTHNEIVGYTPKIRALIAKDSDISSLDADFVDFANENDLAIVLI